MENSKLVNHLNILISTLSDVDKEKLTILTTLARNYRTLAIKWSYEIIRLFPSHSGGEKTEAQKDKTRYTELHNWPVTT